MSKRLALGHLETASGFARQTIEHLLENSPVRAWTAMKKVAEYIEKAKEELK